MDLFDSHSPYLRQSPYLFDAREVSLFESMTLRMDPVLLRRFFSFWPVEDILALSATSFLLQGLYMRYRNDVWNIDRRLRSWFANPLSFRSVLGECNGIVGGSQALQFFDRDIYPDSDLDIFLKPGAAFLMAWWLEAAGFRYEGCSDEYDGFAGTLLRIASHEEVKRSMDSPIIGVHNFRKFTVDKKNVARQLRVQLVVVRRDPIAHVVFGFHSSKFLPFILLRRCPHVLQLLQ